MYNSSKILFNQISWKNSKKIDKKFTVLEFLVERLKQSKLISEIIIACSENKKDNQIVNLCKRKKISFYVGSEINVLDRYYRASKKYKGDTIIRITSDCPLMDPKLLDNFIKIFKKV